MFADIQPKPDPCHCVALRQASRHVSQLYDRFLAPARLRTTQFSILAKLKRSGPATINVLARGLVMDRITLARNLLPLEREGLIVIVKGGSDRRTKELHLADAGAARLRAALKGWIEAQARFEAMFGRERALVLFALSHTVSATDLGAASAGTP